MAVAVKNTPETTSREPLNRLAVGSLTGTVYFLASLAVVFYALPAVWSIIWPNAGESFVARSLLFLLAVAAAGGLAVLGKWLIGDNPPHGLRAGIFVGVVAVLLIALFTVAIGNLLQNRFAAIGSVAGVALTVLVGLGLLIALGIAYFRSAFDDWLIGLEDQGWFSAAGYKRSQGQRVRRGTILAILTLAGCGIYTMISHDTLQTVGQWQVVLPFTDGTTWILLPSLQFSLPILLAAGSLWFSYRFVNYPPFADFLIATEAELNKVSWTTRKRLVQDTIVVLTTVLLLTGFLFAVDVIWFKLLSSSWIGVLETGAATADAKAIDAELAVVNEKIKERESELAATPAPEAEKAANLRTEINGLRAEEARLREKRQRQGDAQQEW